MDKPNRQQDEQHPQGDREQRDADVMHGRNLEGAEYGANEREQTEERNRAGRVHLDEAGEIVDGDEP